MGWSHALELCQKVHEFLVRDASEISPERAVVDRRMPPHLSSGAHAEYVDNFIAFALDPDRANHLRDLAVGRLRSAGLPVHEVNDARLNATTLGWQFSGDCVGATSRRLWRLRIGTLALLERGRASGHQLARVVGHFTFAGLLRRSFLAVFDAVYGFEVAHWRDEVELWPSVKRELCWAVALLPLLWVDLCAEWDEKVVATDASEWGRGGVQKTVDVRAFTRAGRL